MVKLIDIFFIVEVVNVMDRILLIEDDYKLCNLIKEYLEEKEYEVAIAEDFINIDKEIDKNKPQLIILDINLPYFDGYYICREIRGKSNIPIIVASARSGEKDQILAIDLGADDYVTKPFKLEILHSKIKAVLRRTYGEYSTSVALIKEELYLDEKNFTINYKERSVGITKNEFKIINMFLSNKARVVKRQEFFQVLWDEDNFVDENTLTVNITRIKNIFKEIGLKDVIKTKRGVGYIFDENFMKEE